MTKQANNSKQTPITLPENIKKSLEEWCDLITSADYCGELATVDGGKVVRVPTFTVTFAEKEARYVFVFDAAKGLYQCEVIAKRQERQRKFGEEVRRLMDEYGFSWELGKVIIKAYPIESTARMNICEKIQEAKEIISNNDQWGWKTQFANEPKEAMLSVIYWYDFHYWLNTRNHQVYNALKNYLFAIN